VIDFSYEIILFDRDYFKLMFFGPITSNYIEQFVSFVLILNIEEYPFFVLVCCDFDNFSTS